MTISTVSGLNSMGDCMVKIEVNNMSFHAARAGSYAMKVPFSSLSRTIQFIHRSGGKVVEVTKLWAIESLASLPLVKTSVMETSVYASTVRAPSLSRTLAQAKQKTDQYRSQLGGKHNKK